MKEYAEYADVVSAYNYLVSLSELIHLEDFCALQVTSQKDQLNPI